jgi:UDP-2,3-diacylglucosamine hydrolase
MRKLYARWYRFKSGLDKGAKTYEIMDVNPDAVRQMMADHQVRRLIHGHTHRPGVHTFRDGGLERERIVLPEWNGCEHVLCINALGTHLETLDGNRVEA